MIRQPLDRPAQVTQVVKCLAQTVAHAGRRLRLPVSGLAHSASRPRGSLLPAIDDLVHDLLGTVASETRRAEGRVHGALDGTPDRVNTARRRLCFGGTR